MFAVAMLAAGTAADYPELVVFGLAAMVALAVAGAWMLVRPSLAAQRVVRPDRVTEGQPALALLTVHNSGRTRTLPLSATESINGEAFAVDVPSLAARHSYEHRYSLPTRRRGRYEIAALEVGHSDPLRLLRSSARFGTPSVLIVHPRTHHIGMVVRGGPHDSEGPTSSLSSQGGLAFHSLREYEHGDDYRLIHWKATARAGRPMVRHHVIPDEPRQLIVLDVDVASFPGDGFEDAVRAAASLACASARAGFPLELRTTAGGMENRLAVDQWTSDELAALDLLADVRLSTEEEPPAEFAALIADVVSSTEGVVLTVVTGQLPSERLEALTALRPRFLAMNLVRLGANESGPPGILTVDGRDSADFAQRWNELMSR